MPTILLIDNTNLACRAFYGTYRGPEAPILSWNGTPTNAIATWSNMLPALLSKASADRVIFALDGKSQRRIALYPEYKAGRSEKPEPLKIQLPIISDIVRGSGFEFVEEAGEEADDLIVELVRRHAAQGDMVLIASADKDFSQVLDRNVRQLVPQNGGGWADFGPDEVAVKYGVSPVFMKAYLAMIGDAADNTPGIDGIGPGKAVRLLAGGPDFDDLCAGIAKIRKQMAPDEIRRLLQLNFDLIAPMPVPGLMIKRSGDPGAAVNILRSLNCRRAGEFFDGYFHPPSSGAIGAGSASSSAAQAELF